MKQRCGIYGGSFNPIHNGHTRLAEALTDKGLVDELWLVVSPLNPLKQESGDLLDDEARISLARLATEGCEKLKVSDVELYLPRPSYMVHTLQALRETHTDKEFILIVGADNWQRFPEWYQAEEILSRYDIIVYPRRGFSTNPTTLPANVTLADTPLIDISATEIRRRIARGTYCGEGLSPKVWKEIRTKGYYR